MQDPNRKPRRADGRNNRSLFRRTIFLLVVLGIGIFFPLVAQLYKLQIVEHEEWERRAANQQTKSVSVPANRGTIYDREGRAMAMSATVYKLILSPMGVYGAVEKKQYEKDGKLDETAYEKALYDLRKTIVDGIVDLFGYDEERLWKRIERIDSGYEVLSFELEEEDAERARQLISEKKLSAGLQLTPSSKRYYPFSSVGSHILGYMGQTKDSGENKVGKAGIEAGYEDVLSGELGRVVTSKNGWGMEMISGYESYFDAQNGYDVTLTVDERIQAMLEQTLAEGIETYDVQNGAFGLAIDPQTGAVLAMASSPDFDPNNWDVLLSEALKDEVEQVKAEEGDDAADDAWKDAWNRQMKNRALTDAYEPGSVFKPITVSIGLEEGAISMDDHFYCSGSMTAGPGLKPTHCHKKSGHLDQTLTEAVENSCNVALMTIAQRIGAETMWKYFEDFGLFDKTGIDMAGEGGSIFWSGGKEYFTGPYGVQSVASSSFGQTFAVTPLQMISAFAAVINGGHLLQPYLVQSVADQDGNTVFYHETQEVRQVISESTSDKVRGILESVVANGSGHNASMNGYRIGGKTGTSEKIDLKGKDETNDDVMCSFMGFAPADDPQVLVLVVYDTPKRSAPGSNYIASGTYISGGNIAAPMAGALIANILDYMGIEKQYSSDQLAAADAPMPYVVGKELTVAKTAVQSAGLECRTVGTGNIVTHQVPSAGVSIPGGSNVILYLGDDAPEGQVETPDLTGLSPTAAKTKLEELGLFMRAAGVVDYTDASVVMAAQSVDAGVMVSPGTVVEVRFVSSIEYGDQ